MGLFVSTFGDDDLEPWLLKEKSLANYLFFSPTLLKTLNEDNEKIEKVLSKETALTKEIESIGDVNEIKFRWELNEDAMATDRLSDGIRRFAADAVLLEKLIESKI